MGAGALVWPVVCMDCMNSCGEHSYSFCVVCIARFLCGEHSCQDSLA